MKQLSLVLTTLFILGCVAFNPARYSNSQVLSHFFRLHWSVDESNDLIYLGLEANTTGWVGFGISESTSGSMPGSDILMATVDGNTQQATLFDRFAVGYIDPVPDSCQDWHLVSASESSSKTFVEVTRKLSVSSSEDRPFVPGEMQVIIAVGASDSLVYHGSTRHATVVKFFGPTIDSTVTEKDTQLVSLRMNSVIPNQFTTYICQSFALPAVADGSIVRFDPIIDTGISSSMAHHMLVHACEDNGPNSYVQQFQQAGECGSPVGNPFSGCKMIAFIWAVGTSALELPAGVGFRIGNATSYSISHLVIEFHYTNPSGLFGVSDKSGVDITWTPTVRPMDAGVMTLGDPLVSLPPIAPNLKVHEVETTCPSECTATWPHPVTVFSEFLHMHAVGARMLTNQFRNNSYLRTTNRIDFYSYGFQQLTRVDYEIQPGDRLNTHCLFDTTTRGSQTNFGIGSLDEMCMDFIFYYPVIEVPALNDTFNLCGYFNAGPGFGEVTICGNNNFALTIVPLPNPVVEDPIEQYPVTFGITDPSLRCDDVVGSASSLSFFGGLLILIIGLFL